MSILMLLNSPWSILNPNLFRLSPPPSFFFFFFFVGLKILTNSGTRVIWHGEHSWRTQNVASGQRYGRAFRIHDTTLPWYEAAAAIAESFDSFRECVCILQRIVVYIRETAIGHGHFDGSVGTVALSIWATSSNMKGNKRQREKANDP